MMKAAQARLHWGNSNEVRSQNTQSSLWTDHGSVGCSSTPFTRSVR